ncbi:MAG: MopE-related protein [Pseudomonadota bacterium]|nr:MopE-related protein [Pseudomonadota bacterium]
MRTFLSLALLATLVGCRQEDPGPKEEPPVTLIDADADGFDEESDCDDTDSAVNPEAVEVCDGLDNDCDSVVDDAGGTTWYTDADADGYGEAGTAVVACESPVGAVAEAGDCDDADAAWHPGAAEDDCADPNDYNCDGSVGYADGDADGFAACAECDDADAAVNPGAAEVCNGADDDCDGAVDDADPSLDATGGESWYADTDGDGFGDAATATLACVAPAGFVADATDCDDASAAVNPGAAEVCNTTDDDCDGLVDDADPSLDVTSGQTWYADTDGDGFGDAATATLACVAPAGLVADATDCDDAVAAVSPAATEVCNTTDDDCDGAVDDADTSLDTATATTWYTDGDADGYGDAGSLAVACEPPTGTVADATDCDDVVAAVNPAAAEVCNEVDDDCDGAVDPGLLGSGAACPGASCEAILADGSSVGDGAYSLEGISGAGFDAWCDMTTDGGGWTLVGSIVNDIYVSGSHIRSWDDYATWTDSTTFGSMGASQTADYKGEAWSDVAGDDILVVTDEYSFAFHNIVGAQPFGDHVAAEYASTCNSNFLASGADWYDGLTAEQAEAFSWVVRPLDTNATCFPTGNEAAIIGVQLTECCWTPGMGNTPAGYASWDDYDLSLLQASRLAVQSCTAGVYPCNDNGKQFTNASSGYTYETKVVYAETYVR